MSQSHCRYSLTGRLEPAEVEGFLEMDNEPIYAVHTLNGSGGPNNPTNPNGFIRAFLRDANGNLVAAFLPFFQ
jgi:hypothetical protein